MSIDESRLLKLESVRKIIPVSKATWYRMIKVHKKLKPIKIGRGSFWREQEIKQLADSLDSK